MFSLENHSTKSFEWCPIRRTSGAAKQTRNSCFADNCFGICLPPIIGSGSGRLTPDKLRYSTFAPHRSQTEIWEAGLLCNHKQNHNVGKSSGHDDFFSEAAGSEDQKNSADDKESEAVGPEMLDACATKDDAAGDVDEVGGGDEVADGVEEGGHGLAGENVAGEKDAGKNGQKSELHGFRLGICFAGDENSERECGEEIGQRKNREQQDAPVNGHAEDEAHEEKNETELEEADAEVGE